MPSLLSVPHRIREKMNVRPQWVVATCANYQGDLSSRQTHWTSTELMALSVNGGSVLWTGTHMNLQHCPCRRWWWEAASKSPSVPRLLALSVFRVSSTSVSFMTMAMEQVTNLPLAKIALIKIILSAWLGEDRVGKCGRALKTVPGIQKVLRRCHDYYN